MEISKKDLIWYQDAIEKLSPLRFFLNEVLERIDSHNRFAKQMETLTGGNKSYYIRSSIFKEARETLNKAEEFFSKRKK